MRNLNDFFVKKTRYLRAFLTFSSLLLSWMLFAVKVQYNNGSMEEKPFFFFSIFIKNRILRSLGTILLFWLFFFAINYFINHFAIQKYNKILKTLLIEYNPAEYLKIHANLMKKKISQPVLFLIKINYAQGFFAVGEIQKSFELLNEISLSENNWKNNNLLALKFINLCILLICQNKIEDAKEHFYNSKQRLAAFKKTGVFNNLREKEYKNREAAICFLERVFAIIEGKQPEETDSFLKKIR